MEFTPPGRRFTGPPLAWQILGLLTAGLVVAQLVTLVLTLLLPPAPQKRYDLGDVAHALAGDGVADSLQRTLQVDAPEVSGPGWLTSERSRHDLAQLLHRGDGDVMLYFYTPLPFAGTARGGAGADALEPLAADDGPRVRQADFLLAQAGPPPRPPASSNPPDRGQRPGLDFSNPTMPPGSMQVPGSMSFPGGMPNGVQNATSGARGSFDRPLAAPNGGSTMTFPANGATAAPSLPRGGRGNDGGSPGDDRPRDSIIVPRTGPRTGQQSAPSTIDPTPTVDGAGTTATFPRSASPGAGGGVLRFPDDTDRGALRLAPPAASTAAPTGPVDAQRSRSTVTPEPASSVPPATTRNAESPATGARKSAATPLQRAAPLAATTAPRGLFGLAPAPFVEGDFLAAVAGRDGWVVVQPIAEPFPNSWQRRVLLWFAVSFAVIAPIGWLFARRLVRPIAGFAIAAERLGRDPTAPVMALEGPAEVGRAAHAFNRMQSRLRSFVDDRTAMIGAISHDLRTPLTRLRFRIEEVDDKLQDVELRQGMLHEVEEMEAMITSVLAFIRDASEPGSRERLDLATIVEDVVEDAVFVGNDVTLTLNEPAVVEVDAIGMRRLLTNLIENAVKYGEHARVRLFIDRTEAIAEVADDGPGLPDDELERVFEPFYRAQAAKASDKQGSGLGLAVCRSIARAHGGDVRLFARREAHGLVAQVRLPLAYGTRGMKAA